MGKSVGLVSTTWVDQLMCVGTSARKQPDPCHLAGAQVLPCTSPGPVTARRHGQVQGIHTTEYMEAVRGLAPVIKWLMTSFPPGVAVM